MSRAEAASVGDALSALADPIRRSLFERLADHGPATASVLVHDYAVTRQAIVKHLQALEAAGLIAADRVGREVRYGVVPGALTPIERWVAHRQRAWERRLDRLGRSVGQRAGTTSSPR